MKNSSITTVTADDIRRKRAAGEKSLTDWDRVRAKTDKDIEQDMRDDPEWADLMDIDWSDAVMVYPIAKKAVSLRVDEDVLDFFKSTGKGYQTRMNAVLRHYMTAQTKTAPDTPDAKLRPKTEPHAGDTNG